MFAKFLEDTNKIQQTFRNLDVSNLEEAVKTAKKELVDAQKELNDIFKDLNTMSKFSPKYSAEMRNAVKEGKNYKEVQEQITKELEEQVTQKEKSLNIQKEELRTTEENLKKLQVSATAMPTTLRTGKTAAATSFQTIGKKDQPSTSITDSRTLKSIREIYEREFSKGISSGKSNLEIAKSIQKAWSSVGIQVKNQDTLNKALETSRENYNKILGEINSLTSQHKILAENISKTTKEIENARKEEADFAAYNEKAAASYERMEKVSEKVAKQAAVVRTAEANQAAGTAIPENTQALEQAKDTMNDYIQTNMEVAESNNESDQKFKDITNTIKQYVSVGMALREAWNQLKQTFSDVGEIDKSFAEIAMVTDYSVDQMWSSYDQYARMANELGQSTNDVIKASGLFYQQGKI